MVFIGPKKYFPNTPNLEVLDYTVNEDAACKVSPLVWSIFVGQNADLTSGRHCIVIFVGEKEREVPDRLTVWSQGFVYDNNNEELRSTNQDGYG